jgi:hypothetical protein
VERNGPNLDERRDVNEYDRVWTWVPGEEGLGLGIRVGGGEVEIGDSLGGEAASDVGNGCC